MSAAIKEPQLLDTVPVIGYGDERGVIKPSV
jgi:hypothetical protein